MDARIQRRIDLIFDYRRFNDLIISESYPIHSFDNLLQEKPSKSPSSLKDLAFEVVFAEHLKGCLLLCNALFGTRHAPLFVQFTSLQGFKGEERTVTLLNGFKINYLDLDDGRITSPIFGKLPVKISKLTYDKDVFFVDGNGRKSTFGYEIAGIVVDQILAKLSVTPLSQTHKLDFEDKPRDQPFQSMPMGGASFPVIL